MKAVIQTRLGGNEYSTNRQELEIPLEADEAFVRDQLKKAKMVSDLAQETFADQAPVPGQEGPLARQLTQERALLMTRLSGLEADYEKAMVLVEALRREMGDEKYFAVAAKVYETPKYRAIGYHNKKDE